MHQDPPRERVHWYAAAVVGAALVVFVATVSRLRWPLSQGELVFVAGTALGCIALQAMPITALFRGTRFPVHADRGLLLIAFLELPTAWVVTEYVLVCVVGQVLRRGGIARAAFAVATQSLGVAAAALAVTAATSGNVRIVALVLLVPFIMTAMDRIVDAARLAMSPRDSLDSHATPALFTPIAISTLMGIMSGTIAIALYLLSPFALLLLAPPAAFLRRQEELRDRQRGSELRVRRALDETSEAMLTASSDREIAEAALRGCRVGGFVLAAGIVLTTEDATSRDFGDDPREFKGGSVLRHALHGGNGATIGQIWLVPTPDRSGELALDRELLDAIATRTSLALAKIRLLESMRRSKELLTRAFEAMQEAAALFTRDGEIVSANVLASGLFGEPARLEKVWETLSATSAAELTNAIMAGRTRTSIPLASQDGERVFEGSLAAFPLDESTHGMLLIARDVTERLRLEGRARSQHEALVRAERLSALGVLVAGVAHEVNNPLAYMQANLDFVMMDLDTHDRSVAQQGRPALDIDRLRQRLETVSSGTRRIAHITKSLKIITPTSGPHALGPIDVARLVRETETAIRPLLPPHVSLRLDAGDACMVMGEGEALLQVLLNIVKNAVEAMGDRPGQIRVNCHRDGEEAVVSVSDDGPGIPRSLRGKLFTPFFTTKAEGTGMGLSISYSIVKDHGGTLDVDSREGQGATFTVRLPLTHDQPLRVPLS